MISSAPGPSVESAEGSGLKRPLDFTLVLSGGGARGFAHVGVLRALNAAGFAPSAIVGVSMGAIVGATYSLNPDWYRLLVTMDTEAFPGPVPLWHGSSPRLLRRAQTGFRGARAMWALMRGWGAGEGSAATANALLRTLTQGRDLDGGRVPVAICATDLRTGERVVLKEGPAADAVYASAALAGVLPPLERDGYLLSDGAYADLAPVDVARGFGATIVIAVDPIQQPSDRPIHNGFQALMRAVEICHLRHADLRFEGADLVLRPRFRRAIDVLDFAAKRECIAAGVHAVRTRRSDIADVLGTAAGGDPGRSPTHSHLH